MKLGESRPVNGSRGKTTPNRNKRMSPHKKLGDGKEQHRCKIPECLERSSPQPEQEETAAQAQRSGNCHCDDGKLQGCGQRLGNQGAGVATVVDRAAKLAVQRTLEPDQILQRKRPIEPHLAALSFDLCNGGGRWERHRRRVDGKDAQHTEEQGRYQQQNRYRCNEPSPEQAHDGGKHSAHFSDLVESLFTPSCPATQSSLRRLRKLVCAGRASTSSARSRRGWPGQARPSTTGRGQRNRKML
jgi:hypothetical protein